MPWLVLGLGALLAGCGGKSPVIQHPGGAAAPSGVAKSANHTHSAVPPQGDQLKRILAEAQYHADLGQVHLNHGRADLAIQAFGRAVEIGGEQAANAFHLWGLGKAYHAKGDHAQWKANLEKAAALFGGFAARKDRAQLKDHYCEQLAAIYGELGDAALAVEWIDQMAGGAQAGVPALRQKARLYIKYGHGPKALAALEAAETQAAPGMDQERASYAVAEVLVLMQRFPDAEARLKALSASAEEAGLRQQAKRMLFKIYDQTGRLDELDLDRSGKGGEAGGSR